MEWISLCHVIHANYYHYSYYIYIVFKFYYIYIVIVMKLTASLTFFLKKKVKKRGKKAILSNFGFS